MTEKQYLASKWKPFEVMTVYIKELERHCECFLIGVDFEGKTMMLRPLDVEIYEDEVFEVSIDVISRGKHKPKLRVVK